MAFIPFGTLPAEEHKRLSAKGGRASGAARRRRKALSEELEILLSLPVPETAESAQQLIQAHKLGKDASLQTAILIKICHLALSGSLDAAKFLRDTIGEKPGPRADGALCFTFERLPEGATAEGIMG